jgi:hypothetical protein
MSMTRAKKEILGMSEEEIRTDLEQQRLEKAAAAEMEQTATIIKKTGIFDRVDKLYGDFSTLTGGASAEGGEEGGDTGDGDLGGFGADTGGDLGGFGADTGGEETSAEPAPTEESVKKKDNLLLEQDRRRYEEKVKKYQGIYLNRLMESLNKDERVFNLDEVEKDTETLNSKISDMTKEIDNLIK